MKLAIVVQRAGLEVNGGAEVLALRIAEHLTQDAEVDILTTCALDYMSWKNHYSPGIETIGKVKVHRFPVDTERDPVSFEKFCALLERKFKLALFWHPTSRKTEKRWMREQGPISSALTTFVSQNHEKYDAFLFFTYLYWTTYSCLPLVAEKAVFVPLAHDEWPIRLRIWDDIFAKPKAFIFNTPEEKAFLQRRFKKLAIDGPIAGMAVEKPATVNPQRFRENFGIQGPYVLYAGRIDLLKGCHELFSFFLRLENRPKLVLIGKAVLPIPQHPDIVHLGFVDEETKFDAMAGAEMLVMPSQFESLSIVLLESWLVKRPVLVNGKSEVLVGQCERSGGGLSYKNFAQFKNGLYKLQDQSIAKRLGEQGFEYVNKFYSWPAIESIYLKVLKRVIGRR